MEEDFSSPQANSQTNSSRNSSKSVDGLMSSLRKLMASVKVTNPVARQDPDLAVREMAKTIHDKFQPGLIRKVISDLQGDPDAKWPTTGEMLGLCYDVQRHITDSKRPNAPSGRTLIGRPSKITEETFMRSEAGQIAVRLGYARSYWIKFQKGTATLDQGLLLGFQNAMRDHAVKRREVLAELITEREKGLPSTTGGLRDTLIKVGERLQREDDELRRKYLAHTMDV